jgi:hypothetical protein
MECMMMHPSMLGRVARELGLSPAWTPEDSAAALAEFNAHADQAIALTLAPVVDIATRERVR